MTGKIALVTGAGSGIGRATAWALLGAGYSVVFNGRNREKLEAAAAHAADPAWTMVCAADVGDPEAVAAMFAAVKDRFGRLDLLFNNAGGAALGTTIDETGVDDWNRVVAANLTGTFLCTREAFRLMRGQDPQGGRIINNGSISAHVPRPLSAPYTATKHGVTGLTKSTALDGRAFNIACCQIDIGNAATGLTRQMEVGMLQADGSVRPEPLMSVDDVARAIVFMDSLPLEANVPSLTIMATLMPYIGRG
ncbi:MAG: SDR family NAD(P)-dependent oxidoreductase [Alphaproteobacteria bacterium]|nr:SDR family NAD(P)-dependent oxidoreductase [Alphaproteobacteria bacterium]